MPAIVHQHIDQPVILVELTMPTSAAQLAEVYMQTIDLAQAVPGPVYRVFDLRALTAERALDAVASVLDIVRMLATAPVTPEVNCAFVHESLVQYPTSLIAECAFAGLDSALAFAATQVAVPVLH